MRKTILECFTKNARRNPKSIAIYTDHGAISYEKFYHDVVEFAQCFRLRGIKENTIVAIAVPRSYIMMVAIFAVIMAGGAYLPVDISSPLERRQKILRQSKASFVVFKNTEESWVTPDFCESIFYQPEVEYFRENENIENQCISNSQRFDSVMLEKNQTVLPSPEDLIYVMYTSGSSGEPKGVLIKHASLENRLFWMQNTFPLTEKDVIFQKTSVYFDVSVWEILWWAMTGASVVLLPPNREHDVILFVKLIEKYQISVIHFVPSVLKIFLDYIETDFDLTRLRSLRYVFSSGEALDAFSVNRFNHIFKHQSAILVNLYGPTEGTIDVTYFTVEKDKIYEEIPIGSAIDQTQLYVLDEHLCKVPQHEVGELYIGGVGVAVGYLNDPALTKQSFIPNPFVPEEIIYKTGDLVKLDHASQLIYIGRKDHQIKIHGIRIELGEIESCIKSCVGVKDAHVIYSQNEGASMLFAFVIVHFDARKNFSQKTIENFLSQKLPGYMLPTKYFFVERFVLKNNGKIDDRALMQLSIDANAVLVDVN